MDAGQTISAYSRFLLFILPLGAGLYFLLLGIALIWMAALSILLSPVALISVSAARWCQLTLLQEVPWSKLADIGSATTLLSTLAERLAASKRASGKPASAPGFQE